MRKKKTLFPRKRSRHSSAAIEVPEDTSRTVYTNHKTTSEKRLATGGETNSDLKDVSMSTI